MFKLKRAYEPAARSDGFRVLVERLWPRGVTRAEAALDLWLKDVAPSTELRKWFAHDVSKWEGFRKKYETELNRHPEAIDLLREQAEKGTVTLVYAARDAEHNGAIVLKDYLSRAHTNAA